MPNRFEIDGLRDAGWPSFAQIIHKIFVDDWMLKSTALVITFALWFGVTGLSTPITKRFTVPLVPSIATDAEITNTLIRDVGILISGDKRIVDQINPSDLVASLDLTGIPHGIREISLTPETVSVSLPQGVKLTEIQPTRIPVNLEAVEEKDVDVKVVLSGSLEQRNEVYSANVVPARIRVRGPASYIRQLETIETDPIDLSSRDRDFVARQIPVNVANPNASVFNTVVDVMFRIGERRTERNMSVSLPGGDGRTAHFTLFGPRSIISEIKSEELRIELPGNGETPRVVLPPELEKIVEIRRLTVK